jgi:DNA-binding NarL/FixJ family response regulator
LRSEIAMYTFPFTISTPAPPPGTWTVTLSMKPASRARSSGVDCIISGRRPARSDVSATRAARFADRTDAYVVPARTSVPPAVASAEMVTQSATRPELYLAVGKQAYNRLPAMADSEITVLIVDDHEVVREGLRLSLSRAPRVRVIGEASDGESAVALAERRRPNVVIMDVRMPGMDGLEATKLLTAQDPNVAVLIFTAYSERSLLSRGLDSGAKGYILKEAPHETLVRAIEKVADGEGYVDPALMPAFLSGKDKEEMLTTREREILQLLADGMSNADVATKLFISQETVKSHVRHILAKLEADTRTHAVAIALREAIID